MKNGAIGLAVGGLLLLTGCTSTQRIVGHNGVYASDWYGELGITGHVNTVTVKSGSKLDKLSIIGDMNKVFVEDRVVLGKIEIWGEHNEVDIPERLIVRDYRVGQGNKILRREPGGTVEVVSPDTEILEGQQPGALRYNIVPAQGRPNETPTGPDRVKVKPAGPEGAPGQAPAVGGQEILEVQPSEPREQLQPGVHNPGESSNPQNPPK